MSPAAGIDPPSGLRFDPKDVPPGFCFDPDDNELIMLYLLPRVRGQPDPFPGLIVEDDSAANTQPWKLFTRHGRPKEAPAFFYVRTDDGAAAAGKKGARRPDRSCHGGGTWKSMKRKGDDAGHELLVGGEKIMWSRHNLNLNMGEGSVGWVMHEYSITASPSHRICRISFTGHGKKRMREPDDFEDDDLALAGGSEPVPRRARVAAADDPASASSGSGSGITTTAPFVQDSFMPINGEPPFVQFQQQSAEARTMEPMLDQDAVPHMNAGSAGRGFLASCASWTSTTSFDQDVGAAHASQDQEHLQHLSDDEAIAEMIAEMTAEMKDMQAQPFMDPLLEEGPSFCYEPNPNVSDVSAGTKPKQGVVTCGEEPFMPNDGELPLQFQQQFNKVRTVEQMVDQNVVPHMDDAGTGAQVTYNWEGYNFCFDF